jgi:hypothetical protein
MFSGMNKISFLAAVHALMHTIENKHKKWA